MPAAGRGERFGSQKLLALINGEPLLDWTLWSLIDAGVTKVVVVTGPGDPLRTARRLGDPQVKVVVNPDPSRGMFSSIQEGLATVTGDPILVMPADMPFVSSGTVAELMTACRERQRVVVPVFNEKRGHPIVFPAALRAAVVNARPESTLKDALGASLNMRFEMAVGDAGVLRDVDVPADLDERS